MHIEDKSTCLERSQLLSPEKRFLLHCGITLFQEINFKILC